MTGFNQKSKCTLPTPLLLGRIGLNQSRISVIKSKIDFNDMANIQLGPPAIQVLQELFPGQTPTCGDVMKLLERNIDYFNTISGGGNAETKYCLDKTKGILNQQGQPIQTSEPFPDKGSNTCYLCNLPILNKIKAVTTENTPTFEEKQLYQTSINILNQHTTTQVITLKYFRLTENSINIWAFNSVVAYIAVNNFKDSLITPAAIKGLIDNIYQTHPMYPEGEHVIDYKRAGYMNILSTAGRAYNRNDPLSEAWRHQYAWAHRCCNQFKSQGDFCYWGRTHVFEVDKANIASFYQEISNPNSNYAHVKYFHGPNGPLLRNYLGQPLSQQIDKTKLITYLDQAYNSCIARVQIIVDNVNKNRLARIENIFSSECIKNIFGSFVKQIPSSDDAGNKILSNLDNAEEVEKEKNDIDSSIDNLLNDWTKFGASGLYLELAAGSVVPELSEEEAKEVLELVSNEDKDNEMDLSYLQTPAIQDEAVLWRTTNDQLQNFIQPPNKVPNVTSTVRKFIDSLPPTLRVKSERAAAQQATDKIKNQMEEEARKKASWEKNDENLNLSIQYFINIIDMINKNQIKCQDIVNQFVAIAKDMNMHKIPSAFSGFPARKFSALHSQFKFTEMPDGSIYVKQR